MESFIAGHFARVLQHENRFEPEVRLISNRAAVCGAYFSCQRILAQTLLPQALPLKMSSPGQVCVGERPRKEAPDGLAGGKIVKVDHVIWDNIADQQTASAALQAGEIDYVEAPLTDLFSEIESDPELELQVLNNAGEDMYLRINCLQKPFDTVKARQTLLHLVDQKAMVRAAFGDPKYFNTVTSTFGNEASVSSDETRDGSRRAAIRKRAGKCSRRPDMQARRS